MTTLVCHVAAVTGGPGHSPHPGLPTTSNAVPGVGDKDSGRERLGAGEDEEDARVDGGSEMVSRRLQGIELVMSDVVNK